MQQKTRLSAPISRIIVVFAVLALIFTSCSGKSEQEVYVFDPYGDYPEFPLSLSDIADVSFIKMGGEEDGINLNSLWGSGIFIDDFHGRIFASDHSIGVLEFDMAGKFLRKLGRLGNGPGEYTFCSFYVQPEKERVGIYEEDQGKFLIYDYDGTYLPDEGFGAKFINDSIQTFLCQDGYLVVFHPSSVFTRVDTGITYVWSKKTLELVPIGDREDREIRDIHFAKPRMKTPAWLAGPRTIMVPGYLAPSYSGLMMPTYRCDTTYVIKKDLSWRPFLVNTRHNGIEEGCLYPSAETKDYLFLCHQNNQKGGDMFYFAIDKRTKQAYKITDDDSNPLPGHLEDKAQINHRGYTKNSFFRYWEFHPQRLKEECYDYLPQDLKVLVDQCDEDSNPILMIIKLKD